jgi:hypothetical protein
MKPGTIIALITLLLICLVCSSSGSGLNRPAAEIQGDYWFHVSEPLTMKSLKGKVILIDVWQFT